MGAVNQLNTMAIAKLGPCKYCDGAGFWLHKFPAGNGQWILHVTIHGKRLERGLGSFPVVSLKAAREKAEGVVQPDISLGKVKSFKLLFPALKEQRELVPQDPNDESAQMHLVRIRETRATTHTTKRGRKACS